MTITHNSMEQMLEKMSAEEKQAMLENLPAG
jgi:hypothetical protein